MKAVWIFVAFAIFAFNECTSKDVDDSFSVREKRIIRWSGNKTLTFRSCPQEYFEEVVYDFTLPDIEPFPVLCNNQIAGPGWTVITSRSNINFNFFRNWNEYKKGFGDLSGDFFIGLDKLHAITKSQKNELYIHLEDFDGETRFARYDEFYIENESLLYKLSKLGNYTGNAGNAFTEQRGQNFTTFDKDNDAIALENCAKKFFGAGWYRYCHTCNLFGMYLGGEYPNMYGIGMTWNNWRGQYYSYKTMKMMVRPKCSCS